MSEEPLGSNFQPYYCMGVRSWPHTWNYPRKWKMVQVTFVPWLFWQCAQVYSVCTSLFDVHKFIRCAQVYSVCTSLFGVYKFIRCAQVCSEVQFLAPHRWNGTGWWMQRKKNLRKRGVQMNPRKATSRHSVKIFQKGLLIHFQVTPKWPHTNIPVELTQNKLRSKNPIMHFQVTPTNRFKLWTFRSIFRWKWRQPRTLQFLVNFIKSLLGYHLFTATSYTSTGRFNLRFVKDKKQLAGGQLWSQSKNSWFMAPVASSAQLKMMDDKNQTFDNLPDFLEMVTWDPKCNTDFHCQLNDSKIPGFFPGIPRAIKLETKGHSVWWC